MYAVITIKMGTIQLVNIHTIFTGPIGECLVENMAAHRSTDLSKNK